MNSIKKEVCQRPAPLYAQLHINDSFFFYIFLEGDVQFNLKDYANDARGFKRAVNRVQYRGGQTNTERAFDLARQRMFTRVNGDRDYARNFILHLTANDKSAGKTYLNMFISKQDVV